MRIQSIKLLSSKLLSEKQPQAKADNCQADKQKAIIPFGTTCYKCGCAARRREIDRKGNRTGKYLCISCYGQFLCIRNR